MNPPNDFISLTGLLKAIPVEEGGERIIYMEASNETIDAAGEQVLTEALAASARDYERFGNVDIDHYTIIGPRMGIPHYLTYEIGQPCQVVIDGKHTFVKARLYQGDSPAAAQANLVWESMTHVTPPARWYPSIGGAVLEKESTVDKTGRKITLVKKVRWTNTALSRTPVNQALGTAQSVPFAVFAKCWTPDGLNLTKALEAGQTYNIADASGGQALRRQSLDHRLANYWDWRDQYAQKIRDGTVKVTATSLPRLVADIAADQHISHEIAVDWIERFLTDVRKRKTS